MKRLIPITFVLLHSFSAIAEDFTIYGAGASDSCGTWVSDRKTEHRWHQAGQWALGYISGAGDQSPREFRKTDTEAIHIWLDNYCQNDPLARFIDATRELLDVLEKE